MDTKPLDTPTPSSEPFWRRLLPPRRIFLLILCLGAIVRFYGLNWDQSTGQHPDERHVMMCTARLEWPKSLAEYFSESTSPLNPRNRGAHFYAYGTLPSTLLRGVAEWGGATRPEQIGAAARPFSALFDVGTIVLVYALGLTLYRRSNVALLGAFLYAFAVLPIQHAHFFVVDPFANFFVALALLFLARAWRSGRWREYALTGVALGLGIACKISVATFGLPVALVALLPSAAAAGSTPPAWPRRLLRAAVRVALFSLVTVVTVRVALPDAFVGLWPWQLAPRWLANMREVINISTGVVDIVFTRQFYGRTPLIWPWWNMVVWGLGVPLGLSAWAGWLAAGWRLARWRETVHFVPFCWVATVFFHQGFTYQATLRYFLPAYGCLCLLAGWALVEVARWGWSGWTEIRELLRRPLRAAALLVPWIVGSLTVAWALGFLSIYSQPHTRVEASKWIYDHVPRGAVLACEHWDDWLPLPLPDMPGPGAYKQIEFPHYVADNPEKRGDLLAKLNQTDYIILASQKLRDSIPRGPHRYPFTVDYYLGLEDGSLGFDLVASFKRPIRFLGWRIWDRQAEEAFSVYDHPPVYIYKKSPRFDPERLVRRFNAIPLDGVTDTREPEKPQSRIVRRAQRIEPPGKPESAILLPPERWAAAQQEGTWSKMFDRQSFAARYPVVAWVAMLLLLQAVGWALLGGLLRRLPDRGAALARPFGLLIPAWALWWLASKGWAKNTAGTWWTLLLLLALLAGLLAWRSRDDWREWWRDHRASFIRVELCFWVAFFAFLLVRLGNPDLWHPAWGGEKPMEMTFMYGVLRSEEFPPLNPWFAGGFINYYYFGFVLCGVLIKGLGVLPEYGFNLCLATFFGLACAATLSAARALRPRDTWLPAWTAMGFVMVLGNLFQIRFIWNRLVTLGQADHDLRFPLISDVIRAICGVKRLWNGEHLSPYLADLYWVAARAIGVSGPNEVPPITEFPYWSFLYADLHPHLIALPFTLCVIALLVAWVQSSGFLVKCGLAGLLALTLGFFWPTNTWDWPTYGALTGLMLFLNSWRREAATPTLRSFGWAVARSVALFLVLLFFGWWLFRPYHQDYVAGYGSFERWTGDRTSLRDYLFIYGLPLFVLLTGAIVAWRRGELRFARGLSLWAGVAVSFLRRKSARARTRLVRLGWSRPQSFAGMALALLLLALGLAVVLRSQLNALLVAGIALSIALIWERRTQPLRAAPALLTLIAFGLSLMVELIVLVGDIGRMNTVFKFYYQVWVCFGLAAALALPDVLDAVRDWRPRPHRLWMFTLCALIFAAGLYPALGTPTKIRDRFVATPPTLDGLAFADRAQYHLKDKTFPLRPDLLAIRWLQDHVQGSPVLLEMNTGSLLYTWGSRYAVHTGLPTPAGWSWHQRQQQAGLANNRVDERIAETQLIYRTPDTGLARRLLDKFQVGYLVVGELERLFGTPEGVAKFEQMGLEKVYDAEGVQIYRVPKSAKGKPSPAKEES